MDRFTALVLASNWWILHFVMSQPSQQQPLDRSAAGEHAEAGGGAGGGRGLQLAGRRLHHADRGSDPGAEGWDSEHLLSLSRWNCLFTDGEGKLFGLYRSVSGIRRAGAGLAVTFASPEQQHSLERAPRPVVTRPDIHWI